MNILLVDGVVLLNSLREAGHNVLHFSPSEVGTIDLPAVLAKNRFTPDLIFQAEHLARRLLLAGLPGINCPKIFWAIDSHLNLYWQRYYARLFDAVLTPHPSLWRDLPPEWRHPCVRQFTKPGWARPFKPHGERSRLLSLVGVLNKHRHLRLKLAELLKTRWGVEARQNIAFNDMLDLYDDTRLIPNESIAREVNFRLMETASCGAVPLTQDVGPDQDSLFEPGREMLVYRDAVELVAQIEALAANPERAEAIGRAAWERVQREHLPAHRVAQIEALAQELARGTAQEPTRGTAQEPTQEPIPEKRTPPLTEEHSLALLWLCNVQMHRSWQVENRPVALLAAGESLLQTPEILAYRLRLVAEYDKAPAALPALEQILAQNLHRSDLDLNLAGSLIAVRARNWPVALQFWLRQTLYGREGQNYAPGRDVAKPQNFYELCLAWSDLLPKAGRKAQLGLTVNSAAGIPECAWTVLLLAQTLPQDQIPPKDLPRLKRIEALTANIKGLEFYHLGYLAQLCLAEPDDWRLQMRYADACLQTFRLEEGLAERAAAEAKRAARTGG